MKNVRTEPETTERQDHNPLAALIIKATMTGELAQEGMRASFALLNGAPILRDSDTPEMVAAGIVGISYTQDKNGQLLVAGKNYMLNGEKVKILREVMGGGNVIDTYSHVVYINRNLEEQHVTVDAKYPRGLMGGPVYRSNFIPLPDDDNT